MEVTEHAEAVQLLYDNLGALPHEEYGHINIMPFAHDSDQVSALKRQVAEGIVHVLSNAGLLRNRDAPPSTDSLLDVHVQCRMCSSHLFSVIADDGVANVPAASLISSVARLGPDCPHKVVTIDDQRRLIEGAVLASQGEQ